MNIDIEIGSKWEHRNHAGPYTVILIANNSSVNLDYPITIVYQGKNNKIWCKDLNNFLTTMIPI